MRWWLPSTGFRRPLLSTIAHLSDVHFGCHDPAIVDAVEVWLAEQRPDLVVISGDLTQRARTWQYRLACEFIDRLEAHGLDVLAVPGNHDVPLYDVLRRFFRPLNRYRRFIDDSLCPYWEDSEIAVLGINTARSFTIKDGSVSTEQLQRIGACFRGCASDSLRVLVTHHPLIAFPFGEEDTPTRVAKRSTVTLRTAAEAGVDLLLAGHYHRAFSQSPRDMVEKVGPALIVQAGTATSTRLRGGERQSFNWINANRDGIDLQIQHWEDGKFQGGTPARFVHDGRHWGNAEATTATA